jgi:hypothetical protein
MNTIVIGEPKIFVCKRRSVKRIYRDGEFQEIYEKKNISKGKSPYKTAFNLPLFLMLHLLHNHLPIFPHQGWLSIIIFY